MATYGNMFHLLLEKLSDNAGWVLQLVHDARGAKLTESELEAELTNARISDLQRHLEELEQLGLVVCVDSVWKTTWTGAGVSNWRIQLQFAQEDQLLAEPREGENGQVPGPDCNEYRPTLFAPGYCWCCRARHHHASEVVKSAGRLLKR